MANSTRVSLTLSDDVYLKYETIPEGIRSIVVRKLLDSYFKFRTEDKGALGIILAGNFDLKEKSETK